jgi:hypothetical protein
MDRKILLRRREESAITGYRLVALLSDRRPSDAGDERSNRFYFAEGTLFKRMRLSGPQLKSMSMMLRLGIKPNFSWKT